MKEALSERRLAYLVVAAASILPRLVVLLTQRGTITAAFVDKGSIFAQTFVHHGTYGFIPGHPSAYTQPLYGFFLIPPYWVFGTSWVVVGAAHLLVAAATALLVYEIGRRVVSPLGGLLAASIGASTTLWSMSVLGALASFSIVFTPLWHVRDFPTGAPVGLEPPLADMPGS